MPVDLTLDPEGDLLPRFPERRDHAIGCIGAGFIMREVQLVAYREAGLRVAAIASRRPERARAAAEEHGIDRVHDDYRELLANPEIEIVDVAAPPHVQLEIVREAVRHPHLAGILVQKPLAANLRDATEMVRLCEAAGLPLAANQNMRFDHGIRGLKVLLERGALGEPVLATVEMRAVPHWQDYLSQYDRLTLLNMSIHHLDAFRFLFGEPARVFASARSDPRTRFAHRDGIALYVLEYDDGLRASGWDDVWTGPDELPDHPPFVRWRVEGTEGVAHGTVGWPFHPRRVPSTLDAARQDGDGWYRPRWPYAWFPDAFAGPMANLMRALEEGGPVADVAGRDNLGTMALVEACYRSLDERRSVPVDLAQGG